MARAGSSREVLSSVVEAIYDCTLNPGRWRDTLLRVGELTQSTHVAMGTMDYEHGQLLNPVEYGYDPTYWKLYLERYSVNPLMRRSHRVSLGAVYTIPMLGDLGDYLRSEFYNEWIKPQRCGDLVGLNGLRRGRRVVGFVAHRTLPQPAYDKREVQLMRRLAPHICRSLAISDVLNQRSIKARALEATLNTLSTAVYLTRADGRVSYMNAAAERQIRSGNALRIIGNRLVPVNHEAQTAMTAAIAGAIADEVALQVPCVALALPGRDGSGLVATILPLGRGERCDVSGSFATAVAVLVQDPKLAPPPSGRAFSKLYGLTEAELRVLFAMAPGLGVKEAAAMLGIAEVTARTHLQHIFFKTGTSKQTELLNLLRNSTPPVNVA